MFFLINNYKKNMKENKKELKAKKTLSKKKKKNILNGFQKVLITQKESLNKSQKNFYNSPNIKLGHR